MKNLTLHLHLAVSLCGQKAPKRHISKAKKILKKWRTMVSETVENRGFGTEEDWEK